MVRAKLQRFQLLTQLLFLSTLVSAQELHTFSNGEVADAEKINENFEALKSEISGSGGCSAEQDGSSVVITCADGTSGVLAGAGTVVLLEGLVGEIPDTSTLITGPWYLVDASGVVLGEFVASWSGSTDIADDEVVRLRVSGILMSVRPEPPSSIKVSAQSNSPEVIYFAQEDCHGAPFLPNTSRVNVLMEVRLGEYAVATTTSRITFEAASRRASGKFDFTSYSDRTAKYFEPTECENFATIVAAAPMQEYFPPTEILNAALPLEITNNP